MVKADPKRNYYADLDLQPGANLNEIKKKFRQLALLYHPDRNPGKEEEFNSKFQAIQAAHEVLSDPQTRSKYDQDRFRAGYHSGFNAPRKAPTSTTYRPPFTHFPQPPPRQTTPTSARTESRRGPAGTTGTGANRYAQFAKGDGAHRTAEDDVRARAETYRAWENMRFAQASKKAQAAPTAPKQASTGSPRKPTGTPGREQTGQAPGFGRSQSTRVPRPRRNGFDPTAPGPDEPPAPRSSAYANISRGGASAAGFNQGPTEPRASSMEDEDDCGIPFTEGHPRTRAPYAKASGEKTFFPSNPFSKPTEANDGANSGQWAPGNGLNGQSFTMPTQPNGNSKPTSRNPFRRHNNSSSESSPFSSDEPPSPSTQDTHQDGSQKQQANQPSTEQRRNSHNPPPRHFAPRPLGPQPRHSDPALSGNNKKGTTEQEKGGTNENSKPKSSTMYGTAHFNSPPAAQSTSFDLPFFQTSIGLSPGSARNTPYWAFPSSVLPPVVPQRTSDRDINSSSPQNKTQQTYDERKANKRPAYSFTFPFDETYTETPYKEGTFKTPKIDNINTRFSPSEWQPKFEGSGNDYLRGPSTTRKESVPRSTASPTRGRPTGRNRAPLQEQTSTSSQDNVANGIPSAVPRETSDGGPGPVKFSQEEWQGYFKTGSFNFSGAQLPSRPGSLPSKRPKSKTGSVSRGSSKRPTMPRPASVNSPIDEKTENAPHNSRMNKEDIIDVSSDDAMEVDPKPPAHKKAARGSGSRSEPRVVPVQTSASNPRVAPPPTKPEQAWTDTSQSSGPDLANLKNIPPLAPSNEGLRDLNDLSSTLPFKSGASPRVQKETSNAQSIQLPKLPKGPDRPLVLNLDTWQRYLASMKVYLSEWNKYNKTMIDHFAARQELVARSLPAEWLGTLGDTNSPIGFESYMENLKTDVFIRTHWNIGWEKHHIAMEEFERVRLQLTGGK